MSLTDRNTTQQPWIHWIVTTLREAAWAPLSIVVFYGVGLALGWYELYPPLDIPSHLLGGVAITYFYRAAIRNSQKHLGEIPFLIQTLFAFTATGTTTILWEFYENISDTLLHTQHVFGLNDTIKDMTLGLIGALVITLFYKKR